MSAAGPAVRALPYHRPYFPEVVRLKVDGSAKKGDRHEPWSRPLEPKRPALSYALPSGSLADPAGSNAVVAAMRWVEGILLGPVATSVAVIGVAAVGLMMLSGRIDVRRAACVILGCFILFGAPGIAAGLQALAGGGPAPDSSPPVFAAPPYEPPPLPPPPPPPPPRNPDPYAGAALPSR